MPLALTAIVSQRTPGLFTVEVPLLKEERRLTLPDRNCVLGQLYRSQTPCEENIGIECATWTMFRDIKNFLKVTKH